MYGQEGGGKFYHFGSEMFCVHETIKARKTFNERCHGNVFVAFRNGCFLFRRIVFCGFACLIMHVVFAVFVMYHADVPVAEVTVRHHIGKPNGHRLGKAAGIKQNEVICGQFFQPFILAVLFLTVSGQVVADLCSFSTKLRKQGQRPVSQSPLLLQNAYPAL